MALTSLSTIINRMNRYQTVAAIEEQYKVRDLDDAIRTLKRSHNLPWYIKRGSLRVFEGVYEYPVAADHDYLIYLERQQEDIGFSRKLRARYTSLQNFFEDPDYRNQVAEIWENGTLVLGVKKKVGDAQTATSSTLDTCESTTGYTASGDASGITLDNVNYKEGVGSIKFAVTSSSGTATVSKTLDSSFTDSNYLSKYHFRWVYLDAAPTSITLRLGVDSSNYLYKTVTTQFAGQAFVADAWNLVAMDLNTASTTGTITSASVFAYTAVILTGASTGTYYIDASYLRAWENLDYWYYSKYAVALTGSSSANQEYFYNASDVYATDSSLVGDSEWVDVIMYDALCSSLIDKENSLVLTEVKSKRGLAWEKLQERHPDLKPNPTSLRYRFDTSYDSPFENGIM